MALTEDRTPSPTIRELPSPAGSEETEEPAKIARNTITPTTEQGEATSFNTTPELNLVPPRQIVTA